MFYFFDYHDGNSVEVFRADLERFRKEFNKLMSERTDLAVALFEITNLREIYYNCIPDGKACTDRILALAYEMFTGSGPDIWPYQFSGSQFVLITTHEQLPRLKKIREALSRSNKITGSRGETELSLKLRFSYLFPEKNDDPDQVFHLLNYALERKDLKDIYTVKVRKQLREEMARYEDIAAKVTDAVHNHGFKVFYQPIYDLKKDRFRSAEALARLPDPKAKNGFIDPDDFITIATDTGLINGLTRAVLRSVFSFLQDHPGLPLDTVSVNLTPEQLLDDALIKYILHLGKSCKGMLSRIRFEITEQAFVGKDNLNLAIAHMHKLRKKGAAFYLDDFGTGYSNFSSLMDLEFEAVKFDQSLGMTLTREDSSQKQILSLLASMVHVKKNTLIIFEGIEKEHQVDFCREHGVERIQGYYYSRPLPEDDLLRFLEDNRNGFKKRLRS